MRCASCGTENPPNAKFCNECGTALTGKPEGNRGTEEPEKRGREQRRKRSRRQPSLQTLDARHQTLDASREAREGERRQLTVMFCDLVGSTALSTQLDPEELRAVIQAYRETCATVITRFGGHLAKYIGDGLLVYFGYPQAHEDDAQRAARVGLSILAELPQLNARLQSTVGAHSRAVREPPLQPEAIPLFASLLSLPLPDRYPPLTLTPQKQKEKTQQAILAWLLRESERQPVRFDVEDLHWADPSMLEFLGLLIDQAPTARLLVVLTFRPEFLPPWPPRSHVIPITLSRLARAQTEAMVERVAGGKALPTEILQQIVSKTDGVPLFIEELTKMVLESGAYVGATHASPAPLGIPATLQDALMARLDRLGAAKEIAQLGATLGREFSYELLHAVSLVDEASLQQALAKLVEAEVLYQRGLAPQTRYIFKHALIQDAAYQSLLKSKRQQYHKQIAQVLEERFPETVETQPEFLAHHYTEASLTVQAIPYWQRAGERAIQRSANVEAVAHLTKGLELLKTLPETPERIPQELRLQLALGTPLMATRGWGAPEVEKTYARARELCKQMGETPQLFSVLWGLWGFYQVRAELPTARELGEKLLTLAQTVQDSALLLEAHEALGETLFRVGELVACREHLEQVIALYNPQQHHSLAFLYGGYDPGVSNRNVAAWSLWYLGYPDQALKRIQEALTLAHELSHPFSLGLALLFAASLHQFRREGQLAQERAEAVMALAIEQEFPLLLVAGTISRGWALAEQGQEEEGIAQMRQGLAAYQATGAEVERPWCLALLAETQGKVGQVAEGFKVLDEATAVMLKTEQRIYEAELYRIKGQLMLQKFQVPGSKFQVSKSSESGVRSQKLKSVF